MYKVRQYCVDNAPGQSNTGYFFYLEQYSYCSVSLTTPIPISKYTVRKRRQKTKKLHLEKINTQNYK